jgi:hypothetical protein
MQIVYSQNGKFAKIDGLKFTRDEKTGYYLAAKGDRQRKRLHVYMWEKHHGKVPEGMQIHHKDHNKANNEVDNLECLTHQEHARKHAEERTEAELQRMRDNIIKNVIPKAKAWHKSADGRAWHKVHGREVYAAREPQEYTCTMCGKSFSTRHVYGANVNRFCSNACKSAFRRKMGYDNVEKTCERCGEVYIASKYSKTKYCQKCKNKKH